MLVVCISCIHNYPSQLRIALDSFNGCIYCDYIPLTSNYHMNQRWNSSCWFQVVWDYQSLVNCAKAIDILRRPTWHAQLPLLHCAPQPFGWGPSQVGKFLNFTSWNLTKKWLKRQNMWDKNWGFLAKTVMLWFDKLDFRLGRLWVSPWPWIHQTMGGKKVSESNLSLEHFLFIPMTASPLRLKSIFRAASSFMGFSACKQATRNKRGGVNPSWKWGYSIEYSMTVWCCVIHDTVYQIYTVYKTRKIGYPPPKGMIIDMLENTIQITHLRRLVT